MWTLVIDMKIEICIISRSRYSLSCTGSVTTTRPSQGEKTRSASCIFTRRGSRKNATMKNQKSSISTTSTHTSVPLSWLLNKR